MYVSDLELLFLIGAVAVLVGGAVWLVMRGKAQSRGQ